MCRCCLAHESVRKARFDPLNRPISVMTRLLQSVVVTPLTQLYHLKIKLHSIPRRCQPTGHPLLLPFSKAFAPIHSVTEQSDGRPFPHRSYSSCFYTDEESVGYGDSGLDFLPPGGGWVASISKYLNRTPVEVFREFRMQTGADLSQTDRCNCLSHRPCFNLFNTQIT